MSVDWQFGHDAVRGRRLCVLANSIASSSVCSVCMSLYKFIFFGLPVRLGLSFLGGGGVELSEEGDCGSACLLVPAVGN